MEQLIQNLAIKRNYKLIDSKHLIDPKYNHKIRIFIYEDEKLDMGVFYKSYEQITQDIQHIIFIYNIATIQIKKIKIYKDILKIEFFNINELHRLIIGNKFIPKHSLVSIKDRKIIIEKFGKDNLPTILYNDPMCKLYGFEVDDIIQIERADVLYYRLVIQEE